MHKKTLLPILLIVYSLSAFSQDIENYFEKHQSVPLQKLYLHTDRDFYFLGDTLWFAAYLVDAQSHIPVAGESNLYVELIDTAGQVICHKTFPTSIGFGQGYLSFDKDTVKTGNYLIRSYNDQLFIFGESMFFEKKIKIAETRNMAGFPETIDSVEEQQNINIDFYPEGGFLLAGKINTVAFKITDINGGAENTTGKILDENGNLIKLFSSTYNGMGKFEIVPKSDSKYIIKLDQVPDKHWELPAPRESGIKIVISETDTDLVKLNLLHTDNYSGTKFYIAVIHRGKGLAYLEVGSDKLNKTIGFRGEHFGNGINRLVLLNENYEPLSERLVFINKSQDVNLNLELNNDDFITREKVSLKITGDTHLADGENAGLSISVVNTNALNSKGITRNIKSYLLLDSELKGQVNNPADYFVDDPENSSGMKLNLLMLVQGWRNYIWNDFEKEDLILTEPKFGFDIEGKVFNLSKRKKITNSEVSLTVGDANGVKLFSTRTDKNGSFNFKNISFVDTATFFIQGKNNKNKLYTSIELEPLNVIKPSPPDPDILNSLKSFEDITLSYYRLHYLNELALNDFNPGRDTRLIKEVEVIATKPEEGDGHLRLYSTPSEFNSIKVDPKDYYLLNIFEYAKSGKIPGARVVDNNIMIRNAPVSFAVDMIGVSKEVMSAIPMSVIDKIEILKQPTEIAVFGVGGANGVVSVLTKMGVPYEYAQRDIPGTIMEKIKGFEPFREFYSPEYTDENVLSEAPDYRTTLYWNPELILFNGEAEVSFFTCDNLSNYKIFVEGITGKGKICLGTAEFAVSEHRTGLLEK